VEDSCEHTSSDSLLDSSIDSVHTSSPSHISHADVEVRHCPVFSAFKNVALFDDEFIHCNDSSWHFSVSQDM